MTPDQVATAQANLLEIKELDGHLNSLTKGDGNCSYQITVTYNQHNYQSQSYQRPVCVVETDLMRAIMLQRRNKLVLELAVLGVQAEPPVTPPPAVQAKKKSWQ